MKVKRVSPLSGNKYELDIPVQEWKLREWETGLVDDDIAVYFYELTPEQREYILTGVPPCELDDLREIKSNNF